MTLLADILSSRARAEIFRLLFGLSYSELHLREIERSSGLTIGTIRQELRNLERLDLVKARRDGNRLYYRSNTEHPLYPDIRNLVLKTSGLVEVLKNALDREGVRMAFVFGSVARSQENAGSDVDLIIIGDAGLREVTAWLAEIPGQIGREINPHCMTVKEFVQRKCSEDLFLTNVLGSPKLFIKGAEDELAAMG
ncbi:MAG: nucleotidyltransferase domain-containing protein [Deltaproteobacteria bacterium]|nr:nucleotidyltransferase domain-containing protein [Deltaproteobacteria bacterium]